MTYRLEHGDCRQLLKALPDASVHAIITDPPYPGIRRDYGKWTEAEWRELMDEVVTESKRVLKPTGSAVFVLQPNYKHLGEMSLWLWSFLVDTARKWNLVQNVYWWKPDSLPLAGCDRKTGLCRNSVKYCMWFGPRDCYRDQSAVLVPAAPVAQKKRLEDYSLNYAPSGRAMRDGRAYQTAIDRGGSTPFNLLRFGNQQDNSGRWGHGAGTPIKLADWWVRYIVPPGGVVLDPFAGVASIGVAALRQGRSYIGFEACEQYVTSAIERLSTVTLNTADGPPELQP